MADERQCAVCGKILSIYNPNDRCFRHLKNEEIKFGEKVTAESLTPEAFVHIDHLLLKISAGFGLSNEDLMQETRRPRIVWPRQVAMYLLHEEYQLSLPEIGREFGGMDHTTVIYACRKVKKILETDHFFNDSLNKFKKAMRL